MYCSYCRPKEQLPKSKTIKYKFKNELDNTPVNMGCKIKLQQKRKVCQLGGNLFLSRTYKPHVKYIRLY